MVAIGSLLAGEATAVGLPLAPSSSTEEGATGKTAGLQLHITGNFILEQRAKTPEPDFTDGYRGRGEAESEGKIAGARLVWHPTKQHLSPRGGFFLGLHHYRRVQNQGEDRLETSTKIISFGGTAEMTSLFHAVGLPGNKFYLGFLSGQIFVGPATFLTRMTHYLEEEQENPVNRTSIGLAAGLQVRLASIGVGPALLHLSVDNTYVRELAAVSGGGEGRQDYLQLLAPTAVLEWRY